MHRDDWFHHLFMDRAPECPSVLLLGGRKQPHARMHARAHANTHICTLPCQCYQRKLTYFKKKQKNFKRQGSVFQTLLTPSVWDSTELYFETLYNLNVPTRVLHAGQKCPKKFFLKMSRQAMSKSHVSLLKVLIYRVESMSQVCSRWVACEKAQRTQTVPETECVMMMDMSFWWCAGSSTLALAR